MKIAESVGQLVGKLACPENGWANRFEEARHGLQFTAGSRVRAHNADNLSEEALNVLNREHQVGIVRDDDRDITPACVRINQNATGEIHI